MKTSICVTLAALALAGVGLIQGCDHASDTPDLIRPVRSIKVGDLQALGDREFPGRAAAKVEVDLSFQVPGPLVSLPVDVGSTVKKGETIAAIDPRDFEVALANAKATLEKAKANLLAMESARPEEIAQLRAALAQAEASYQQALAEHDRNAILITKGAATQEEFDISLARKQRTGEEVKAAEEALNIGLRGARPEDLEAKRAEIRALEAGVAAAQNQLDYTTLTAPFDGEVAARYVNNFQTVQAKQPIARLLDVSKIEITVQIPENLIGLVPQVKQVACRFDAISGREFYGKVTKIGGEASRTTRTYPVTVEIAQPDDVRILPGMAATVRRHAAAGEETEPTELIVPASSVFTDADTRETYVWIVDPASNKVARKAIKTDGLTRVGLRVTDGLKAGDIVVTAGVNLLREGQQVRVM